jgi:hypothetical protein
MHHSLGLRTRASAADRVFLDCRGAGILVRHARCTGRALLAVKLVAVHGAGREREPGQDAWMPPRLEEGLRDDRVPGDPGRPGLRDGRQPGIIQRTLTPTGGRAHGTSRRG